MEVVKERVAGIDVHQKSITITTLIGAADKRPKKESRQFGTTSPELRQAGTWLQENQIESVLMESTGQYWRPVWQVLEKFDLPLVLCNPRIIKGIPGKKTDQLDSEWISSLGRVGLVAASFIPAKAFQELRELTRTRLKHVREATSIKNTIHNILQRSNIKLTTYVSDIFQGAGLRLLMLLANGEVINLKSVQAAMKGLKKATVNELMAAMDGELSRSDREILDDELDLLKKVNEIIQRLSQQINQQLVPFNELYQRLQTIPGVGEGVARILIAEIGDNVDAFSSASKLASWAGVAPGNYESAGVSKSSHITHGNVYLKTALVTAAMGAKQQNSGLKEFFYRLRQRMGAQKAIIATAHKILRIIYAMIKTGQSYTEHKKDQRPQLALAQS